MKTKYALLCVLIAIFLTGINNIKAQVDVNDSLALVDLYNSTNGFYWKTKTNWLTGPVSGWFGITLKNDRVTRIDLRHNKLKGQIQSSVGNLEYLSYLNLSDNRLDSIPPEIGNLSNLRSLSLGGNQLSNLPPEVGDLANLTSLSLYFNQLSSIPPEIGNLANLTGLDLSGNQLSSLTPEIGNLGHLTDLNLFGNQLTTLPSEIGKLTNLSNLYLNYNQLISFPPEIGNLVNLWWLDLSFNQLSNLPVEIGKLTSLYNLDLALNQLTSLPLEIGKLTSLYNLDLYYNKLNSLPSEIGNLVNLRYLDLSYNQLNSLPPEIGNMINLWDLDLPYNQLNSLPPEIGNMINLSYLDLSNNKLSSLPPEIGNMINLWDLNLSYNLLSSLPVEIGKLTSLYNLDLYYNKLTSLPVEIGNLSNLVYLNLSNNQLSNIPPETANLNNLYTFDLSSNHFTFDGLEMFLPKLPYSTDYSPQANIPLHQNSNSLFVSAGGTLSNNTYNWYILENPYPTTITGDSVFYPREHGKYYAAVTNSICTQLTLYTDTVDYVGVLPVTLINLKAQQQGGMVKVEWTSLTEINVDRYEIQRAAYAQNFAGIGNLPATGNSTLSINYFFNDVKPLQGNNYYRLKAFDKDGAITYSNMVLVKMNGSNIVTLIYPNPAKNILNIQTNGAATFSLVNQSGKRLLNSTITNSGTMNVSGIAAGVYYLKNNSTGEVKKVVIVK